MIASGGCRRSVTVDARPAPATRASEIQTGAGTTGRAVTKPAPVRPLPAPMWAERKGNTTPPTAARAKGSDNRGRVFYVRPGGGSAAQCTGQANADYPGKGKGRPCAFDHPFRLLPPGGKAKLSAGDTLVIGAGQYRMGLGAPGAVGCDKHYPWDCHMPPIPAGTADRPTRILGEGWKHGCPSAPQLYGVERAAMILNLTRSSNVEVSCLELTDRSGCVEHHSGKLACKRDSHPFGDWAGHGLVASDAHAVTLRHLDIHGLAHGGVHAGRLRDWTIEDVRIAGNGWVGWDGDLGEGGSGNNGRMLFRRVVISHNGCGETYPGRRPSGCWGQSAGGYGDGLGTAKTGGDWVFEDCRVTHNTSDGLDLLYHTGGGTITVRRLWAEGNGGNPLKVAGHTTIESSVLLSNCGFFKDNPVSYKVDDCRGMGNAVELALTRGAKMALRNNTLVGQGDVLVSVSPRQDGPCAGGEAVRLYNNVFVGQREHNNPTDRAGLLYVQNCPKLSLSAGFNLAHGVKGKCALGEHDRCADPRIVGWRDDGTFDPTPRPGSPAIDSGDPRTGKQSGLDFRRRPRLQGKRVDRGAVEGAR